jgi:hypothetical protein
VPCVTGAEPAQGVCARSRRPASEAGVGNRGWVGRGAGWGVWGQGNNEDGAVPCVRGAELALCGNSHYNSWGQKVGVGGGITGLAWGLANACLAVTGMSA